MIRKLFFVVNFAVLGLFLVALVQDHLREWKTFQAKYYDMAAATGKVLRQPLAIKQIIVRDLDRVDRCITCHLGMDEFTTPSLKNDFKENPYKSHPGNLGKSHAFTKIGCTVCHGGQGLALTVDAAHGRIEHWEQPLKRGPYLQSSCVKCHGDFEKLRGAEVAAHGKALFDEHGCVGCHSVRGVGGSISVDLGDVADKPVARIDFSYTGLERLDWNVMNWIELHLTKDPMELAPNDPEGKYGEPIAPSGMPPYYKRLSREEAAAITTYLLSMTVETVPHDHYVYAPVVKERRAKGPVKRGERVFLKYGCAGCHGAGGKRGERNYNTFGENQTRMEQGRIPTLVDVVGTYTRKELRKKIRDGVAASELDRFKADGPVPPLYMPAWKDRIERAELEDLITYLLSTAKPEEDDW